MSRPELKQIEGTYMATRRAASTKLRLFSLLGQAPISIDKDGAAVIDSSNAKDLRLHSIHWKPVAKDLWQEVDGQNTLFAIRNPSGKIIRIAVDFPGVQLERVPWSENRLFVLPVVGLSLVALVAVVIAAFKRLAHRLLLRSRPKPVPQPNTAWLPWPTQVAAWIWVLMLFALIAYILGAPDEALPPTPAWDKYFLILNWVIGTAMLFSAFAIVSAAGAWSRALRLTTRIKYSLVAMACLVLCWFAISYHLIGQVSRI